MSGFAPTDEQADCAALFDSGDSMVIEAGAGTGKTSTLRLLAESTNRRGRYIAFNKAIVQDVAGTFPERVACSTAHSLAYRGVGHRYSRRLGAPRMASFQIAKVLGIPRSVRVRYDGENKDLTDSFLAGWVMRAVGRFCQTADDEPSVDHFEYVDGIDPPDADGRRTFAQNDRLRAEFLPALGRAWSDVQRLDGQLPFQHDHYLKLWQLTHPTTVADFLFFDEAQDANPVMAAVIAEQEHAQRVYVGDSAQAIYEFTGAVNAMANIATDHRRFLTRSFRFGQAIADVANRSLASLGAPLRLVGDPQRDSFVGEIVGEPDAILCRTNATAMTTLLAARERGTPVHLVGGGKDVAAFARGARRLQDGQLTDYHDLACFRTWGEVLTYVEDDVRGDELALNVRLVESFGVDVILSALEGMPREDQAALVVSTAHKAKGREWNRVRIAEDFADLEPFPPELRLRYVAVTRARAELDQTALEEAARAKASDRPSRLGSAF